MVIGGLFALAAARCAAVYDALPPTMASHFDAAGRPNGFMPRDGFLGSFAFIGGFTVLLLLGIPWLGRALPPALINVPNRDYWLAPQRLPQVHAKLTTWAAWFACGTTAFLIAVLELVLRANLTRTPLANEAMVALLAMALLGTLAGIVALMRSFRVPR
jgi:serine/threonine-protein kinase